MAKGNPRDGDRAAKDDKNYPALHSTGYTQGGGIHLPPVGNEGDVLAVVSSVWAPYAPVWIDGIEVERDSVPQGNFTVMNFVGVVITDNGNGRVTISIAGTGTGGGGGGGDPVWFIDGALAVQAGVGMKWVCPRNCSISCVFVAANNKGTASSTIVDVNKNGTTIFTTQANRPTVIYSDADGIVKSAAPDVTSLVEGDYLTVDIDQIATGAEGLTIIVVLALPKATRQVTFTVEGDLEVGASPIRIPNLTGADLTISEVRLDIGTAPTGSAAIVDIHESGTTIFTNQANRPQIADGASNGSTTTIDDANWATGNYLTIEVDQIGSTTAGADLTVTIVCS
jgi:hypothetical protein